MDDKERTDKSREKGKGKESSNETSNDSLAARVAKSASVLSQSLVNSRPKGDDISQAIPAEKGQARSTFPSALVDDNAGSYQRPPAATSSSHAAFRGGQTSQHIAQEEQAFSDFLDTQVSVAEETPVLPPAPPLSFQSTPGESRSNRSLSALSIAEQEQRDGAEVLHLLSQADNEPLEFDDAPEMSDESLNSLRAALFSGGASTTRSREWDTMLNFIPDFVRPDADGRADYAGKNVDKSLETQSAMGLEHSPDIARLWVEQWHDVLTAYTDEVWGDLGPLVQQAKKEIEQLQEAPPDQPPPNTKALQRLRLLLGHIREQ